MRKRILLLSILILFHSAASASSKTRIRGSSKNEGKGDVDQAIKDAMEDVERMKKRDGEKKVVEKKDEPKESIISVPANAIKNYIFNSPESFKLDEDTDNVFTEEMIAYVKSVFHRIKKRQSIDEIKKNLAFYAKDYELEGDLTRGFSISGPDEQFYAIKVEESETEGKYEILVVKKGLSEKYKQGLTPLNSKTARSGRGHSGVNLKSSTSGKSHQRTKSTNNLPGGANSHHSATNDSIAPKSRHPTSFRDTSNGGKTQHRRMHSDVSIGGKSHHRVDHNGGRSYSPVETSKSSLRLRESSLSAVKNNPSDSKPPNVRSRSTALGRDRNVPSSAVGESVCSPDVDQEGQKIPKTGSKFKIMSGMANTEENLKPIFPKAVAFVDMKVPSSEGSNDPDATLESKDVKSSKNEEGENLPPKNEVRRGGNSKSGNGGSGRNTKQDEGHHKSLKKLRNLR